MSALRVLGLETMKWAVRCVAKESPALVFYSHPTEFEIPENQALTSSEPARYRRGLGPQNLDLLARFVDYVLSCGHVPVSLLTLAQVGSNATTRGGYCKVGSHA